MAVPSMDDDDGGAEDQPRARRQNNDRQSRGDKGGLDAYTNSNVAFGFIKELVETQAMDLGAEQAPWKATAITALEKLFGIGMTENVLFPAFSALLTNSTLLRNVLKVVLPSDRVGEMVLESLDGYLEGVRNSYRTGGKVQRKQHDEALGSARAIIQKRMSERTVADAVFMLTEQERDQFNWVYHHFTSDPEAFKKFNFYRGKMNDPLVIREILRLYGNNTGRVLPYLEMLYGPPSQPSKAQGFGQKIVEAAEGFVKKLNTELTDTELATRQSRRAAKLAEIDAINHARKTSRH